MSLIALELGRGTVGWREPERHFHRFAGTLVRSLVGEDDPGTVAAHGVWVVVRDATTARLRPSVEEAGSVAAEIYEIRRRSGLTWNELATVFGVSSRSLHHWANGKPINAANEDRVRRTLATLRLIDRGEAQKNRTMLFEPLPGGGLMIDLLCRGDFETVERLVGVSPDRPSPSGQVSAKSVRHRQPLPPAVLVSARHEGGEQARGRFTRVEPLPRRSPAGG